MYATYFYKCSIWITFPTFCAFHASTNGTLVDEAFCEQMKEVGNLSLSISLEGFEEVNDLRRGAGVYEKVLHAMDLLKASGQIFGTSICYTSKNIETVTPDEFLDMIIEKGCRFTWYFHYMPVGKPIFAMDFQNDGEFVGG